MPKEAELAPQIEQFIHDNPQGVLTSFRRNGMPQLSIVTVYPREGGVGISITENRMKFKNLLRDPRCSVLVSHVDWWSGFLVFEGKAELAHSGNADPEDGHTADEWIELKNNTSAPITLTGWTLTNTGSVYVALDGIIPAGGFFLLERSGDDTVSFVAALAFSL